MNHCPLWIFPRTLNFWRLWYQYPCVEMIAWGKSRRRGIRLPMSQDRKDNILNDLYPELACPDNYSLSCRLPAHLSQQGAPWKYWALSVHGYHMQWLSLRTIRHTVCILSEKRSDLWHLRWSHYIAEQQNLWLLALKILWPLLTSTG